MGKSGRTLHLRIRFRKRRVRKVWCSEQKTKSIPQITLQHMLQKYKQGTLPMGQHNEIRFDVILKYCVVKFRAYFAPLQKIASVPQCRENT